jgi:lipoyl-dependent peroxiredoxin
MIVTAAAEWTGPFTTGTGTLSTRSRTLDGVPYSYASRFEGAPGACPEELVGAALAGCYNHALANISGLAGVTIDRIHTTAEVQMGRDERGPALLSIQLTVAAEAAGVDDATFQDLAERARVNCAISKALVPAITLRAALQP